MKKDRNKITSDLKKKMQENIAAKRDEEERIKREKIAMGLPDKKFYFTIVQSIPGWQWALAEEKLYGLTPEEVNEALHLKFIDKMNSRAIRSCNVVDWGEYKD
jgi:hypothetical protein